MGDLHLNGKEFNFDTNKKISKDELANKNGVDINKLETLFMEYDDIKIGNGLSAKEAQVIVNLFDTNRDNKVTDDEITDEKFKEFIKQNGGDANDSKLMSSLKGILTAISNTFGKDSAFYNVTDANGNVTEKYTLETNNGITKKTRYSTDGAKNNRIAEQWEDGFKNYRKEWTGPNGERTLLEGTDVKDNGDGTYTLTVKRTDSRFPDTTYTMVFDSNGNEISRTDASGNKYSSNGSLLDANGNVVNNAPNATPAAEAGEEKTVVVEKWGKGVTNSTLSGIITSAYGVKYGTDEYFAIEKMVMDANPEIYGDADGNGGRSRILDGTRHNAVIHPGDTLKLPPYDGKTPEPAEGGTPAPVKGGGGATPAPRTGGGGDTPPVGDPDPIGEPDPQADIPPALGEEKVIENADGTITVITTEKNFPGEGTHTVTTKYADASRSKKLSVVEDYGTYTRKTTYSYRNNGTLDKSVLTSNAGGSTTVNTTYYDHKGEARSMHSSVTNAFTFHGEAETYVNKITKGESGAFVPYQMSTAEKAAIIKQYSGIAKKQYNANNYASVINGLIKDSYGADLKNMLQTYKSTHGKSIGADLIELGTDPAYLKSYIDKIRYSTSARSSIDSVDTAKLMKDYDINKKTFFPWENGNKKAFNRILDLVKQKTLSPTQAVAIIEDLYLTDIAKGIKGIKDKSIEAQVMQLLEKVYTGVS